MNKKKKKILFGAVDIGWRIEHYSKFIKANFADKLEPYSFVKFKLPEKQYKTQYTYNIQYDKYPKVLQWIFSLAFFIFALFKFDIFYFLSGETILTRKLMKCELKVYKLFNKKIVMHFVGTDIRNVEILYWRNNNTEKYLQNDIKFQPNTQTKWQKNICTLAEIYADNIIVSTPDLLSFFTKESNKVEFIPVFIDPEKFTSEYNDSIKSQNKNNVAITILHAPSNPDVKGTKYISLVLQRIKSKYPNINIINTTDDKYRENVHPPYTVSKYELLRLYNKADIVIDQALIGWYGLQTVESLFLNKEVICYINKQLTPFLFKDYPIDIVKDGNLEKSIINSISKIITVKNNKRKIKAWVINNHSIENSNFDKLIKRLI